ncbi:hypothetical protein, partial [Pseudomonas viridiflava]|uniref:hypothetical protein n=1 Tax=Pseudomonas viridiflava TaxID=33069 RepID=UPI0019CFD22E
SLHCGMQYKAIGADGNFLTNSALICRSLFYRSIPAPSASMTAFIVDSVPWANGSNPMISLHTTMNPAR